MHARALLRPMRAAWESRGAPHRPCAAVVRRPCRTASGASHDSFIARAREANDAAVLIGAFRSVGCFDYCLEGMHCVAIGGGGATCTLRVSDALANNFGTLHGGAISTLVDVAGTLALLSVRI